MNRPTRRSLSASVSPDSNSMARKTTSCARFLTVRRPMPIHVVDAADVRVRHLPCEMHFALEQLDRAFVVGDRWTGWSSARRVREAPDPPPHRARPSRLAPGSGRCESARRGRRRPETRVPEGQGRRSSRRRRRRADVTRRRGKLVVVLAKVAPDGQVRSGRARSRRRARRDAR